MRSLRSQLTIAFVVATLVPLGATIWIATSLLDRSLDYATTEELDRLSRTLEATARQFYQRERDALRQDALAGRAPSSTYAARDVHSWPDAARVFWESGEAERFVLSGSAGDRLDFLQRTPTGVLAYQRDLGGIRMQDLSTEFGEARALVGSRASRDLRRGFTLTLLLLVALAWLLSLAPLLFLAHRISSPIRRLTAGLTSFGTGTWSGPLDVHSDDEVGRAVAAFNAMADHLQTSRERLVYLTQMSSWQSLARKTAHELKNSLTPIRLTIEEMFARQPPADRVFMEQAVQIVVGEIETLERRVRAFSEFASEPPVTRETVDLNSVVEERIALLGPAHPETSYRLDLATSGTRLCTGADLVKGILTNLLENAAEAAGPAGTVIARTRSDRAHVLLEVHDSGPGLSDDARRALFEPTITFKKRGMGLGLSIARKNALLLGGDISLIDSTIGGAAFRVVLPAGAPATVELAPAGAGARS